MTVRELIDVLNTMNPDDNIMVKTKVEKEVNGYTQIVNEWMPMEAKHLVKTKFGGNNIFIG